MAGGKSVEQFKYTDRLARRTRHHRMQLNHISEQKLHEQLKDITYEYEQTCLRSKIQENLEQQRKEVLHVTVQQITNERKPSLLSRTPSKIQEKLIPLSSKENRRSRPSSSIKMPSAGTSCDLFSHQCQLYPCRPVHHYTSFVRKEHDQTLRRKTSDAGYNVSHRQDVIANVQEKNHQQYRRQLTMTLRNQQHLAHRHISMERTMARLDEQSRLLHERLAEKKFYNHLDEHQFRLRQALQRHLELSAKFCS